MKVAVTNVGSKAPEPEDSTKNENRLDVGKQAMERAISLQADILVLPGGFLVSKNSESKRKLADSLIAHVW